MIINPLDENQIIISNIEDRIQKQYLDMRDYIEQPIKINNKWGIINKNLEFVIMPKYDTLFTKTVQNKKSVWVGIIGAKEIFLNPKPGGEQILHPIDLFDVERQITNEVSIIKKGNKFQLVRNKEEIFDEFIDYKFSNSGFDGFIRLAQKINNETLWGLFLLQNDNIIEQIPIKYIELNYHYVDCGSGKFRYLAFAAQIINGQRYESVLAKLCNENTAREIMEPTKCKQLDWENYSDKYRGTIIYENGERDKIVIDDENYSLEKLPKLTQQVKNDLFNFWRKLKKTIINVDKKRFSEMTIYTDQASKNNFINGFQDIFPSWIRSVLNEQTESIDMFSFTIGKEAFIANYRVKLSHKTYNFIFNHNYKVRKWLLEEIKIYD